MWMTCIQILVTSFDFMGAKYEPQHSVEPRQLTTNALLYLHSVHIQTVGLEVTQLSMFRRMHHPHVPYFALQCSGCIYSYGSYSW